MPRWFCAGEWSMCRYKKHFLCLSCSIINSLHHLLSFPPFNTVPCGIPGCVRCSDTEEGVCAACLRGFILSPSGTACRPTGGNRLSDIHIIGKELKTPLLYNYNTCCCCFSPCSHRRLLNRGGHHDYLHHRVSYVLVVPAEREANDEAQTANNCF